jgi:Phytanoyl-CoA dioxygenase (PhyH)
MLDLLGSQRSSPVLGDQEVERYRADGFLLVDRPLISARALRELRMLLDGLFDRFDRLPSGYAKDLAEGAQAGDKARIPEIERPTRLKPRLLRSEAVAVCTAIARQLHGPEARLTYDHAIYKPPLNGAWTAWHQDAAYAPPGEMGVGIWVPLQDVKADGGCMRFVPGSHHDGLVEHGHLASEVNTGLLGARVEGTDAVTCPVQAGGVALHNIFTVHSAGPNCGTTTRRVWILNFSTTTLVPGPLQRAQRRATSWADQARFRFSRL